MRWAHTHSRAGQFVAGAGFDPLGEEQITVLERVQKETRKRF